jgi:prepilin-type N-terminal cleavage/methylation domain-containing protein
MKTKIARRAFTLVEMLTVIGILAIVMAIVIPAVGMARRAARNADAKNLLGQVGNAVSSFSNDQRRMPGYFSARQMGSETNATHGLTMMENILIDLVGGVTTQAPVAGAIITVGPGPMAADQVVLDLAAMGSSTRSNTGAVSKGYLPMDAKRFVPQGVVSGAITDRNKRATTSADDHYFFPTLVDPFGQPVLAWMADDVPSTGPFTALNTSTSTAGAKYYWAQNAGFLDAQGLGKQGEDQRFVAGTSGSIISSAAGANALLSMAALLGNPASPVPGSIPVVPQAARAPILLQSAGADGVYMGARDRGGRPGVVNYTANQDPFIGGLFDDLIAGAGH